MSPAAAQTRTATPGLPPEIFDARVSIPLIHQVVVAQQAAARQGTHATRTRGMVRGGGKKPYRQKGTGRARQGSIRAPQFAGGGVVHGPVPRSYAQRTPKKMKAAALRGALSDRARHGRVHVTDALVTGEAPSTKAALEVLASYVGPTARQARILVVAARADELTWKSLRNAPAVHLIDPGQLNTYDVLVSDQVVFTVAALDAFVAQAGIEWEGARPTPKTAPAEEETARKPRRVRARAASAEDADSDTADSADTAEPAEDAVADEAAAARKPRTRRPKPEPADAEAADTDAEAAEAEEAAAEVEAAEADAEAADVEEATTEAEAASAAGADVDGLDGDGPGPDDTDGGPDGEPDAGVQPASGSASGADASADDTAADAEEGEDK